MTEQDLPLALFFGNLDKNSVYRRLKLCQHFHTCFSVLN